MKKTILKIPKLLIPFTIILLAAITAIIFFANAKKVPDGFYQPNENMDIDYTKASSRWSFSRCIETEHFLIFWEKDFGKEPNGDSVPEELRVDVNDLAKKLETFYTTETEKLGFGSKSLINGYKLQVYVLYTDEWVATGSGYDNQIGALWVSPSTCQPVGSVIAHEVGHCFQYLIYCEQLADGQPDDEESGFRYSYGNGLGNAFWELSAQWQSWQDYPEEQFTGYEMETWFQNYFRAFENEWTRYQNYWLITYFAEIYGDDWLSTIWRESKDGEDALSCHLRVYLDGDLDRLYRELYEYASHAVTFDFAFAQPYASEWQGYYDSVLYDTDDGWQQIGYANTPEANGFSAVRLPIPENGRINILFEGIQPGAALASDDSGECRSGDNVEDNIYTEKVTNYNEWDGNAGWRYGVVAMLSDGSRQYSPMQSGAYGSIEYVIPKNTELLYLVVLGAPNEYVSHIWDNTESTDVQMPYRIKVDAIQN